MLQFEQNWWSQGFHYIAGVDEVGRGCLFGDVVAAAVILPSGLVIEGINDSKKLTARKRDYFYEVIRESALTVGVGMVDVQTIDEINIKQAARLAMKMAVQQLSLSPDVLLIDAEQIDLPIKQESFFHGDERSQSIAAASIIAKVTRDRLCAEWHERYPDYLLNQHKGYATKTHRERILQYGPTPLHRKTFLRKLLSSID